VNVEGKRTTWLVSCVNKSCWNSLHDSHNNECISASRITPGLPTSRAAAMNSHTFTHMYPSLEEPSGIP
jgi:hypothetical protein